MRNNDISAWDKVMLARHNERPNIKEVIQALFEDFFEQKGDRLSKEDGSILGGIATYHGKPVTVIGHYKGKDLDENLHCNFGMPNPQGYRKALRLMKSAEKFKRPIITFIDTPGAYPGFEAEENGQGIAIADGIAKMSALNVPVIAVVMGEGGSGGALALGVANVVLMAENAVYSVLSPEGFAAILWKDATKVKQAAKVMKLTADDMINFGVADELVPEPAGGAHVDKEMFYENLDKAITKALQKTSKLPNCAAHRYSKYRSIGNEFVTGYDSE